ncbi:MAG TPA: DUF3379 family protein, partial [Woeseiaceae bacterium]|nr:DUF3379 family protein [Woeseiaceae bacterium]
MECEEYRKVITADPSGGSLGQGAGHASDCEACRAYAAEIRALDTRIAQALSLDVPELEMPELPPIAGGGSTVVVDLESRGRRRLAAPAWLGLAAGIAAVLVFVVRQFETDDPDVVLAREVLAHMDHEQSSRRV